MAETVRVQREIPVTDSVDVLVVGTGIAGSVAAVAAAREGARTLAVDRFGYPGGNMGPGLICGAPDLELPPMFASGMPGIPGEFIRRCEALGNAPLLHHYFRDSQSIVYVWLRMFQEAGVRQLMNVYATEPLMDGDRVAGLVLETKDGPRAVRAAVVVDATGDADVACRAGAPMHDGASLFAPGAYFAMANVDIRQYLDRVYNAAPDPDAVTWMASVAPDGIRPSRYTSALAGYYRAAWEAGEYRFFRPVEGLGAVFCDHGCFQGVVGVQGRRDPLRAGKYGLVGAMVGFRSSASGGSTSGSPTSSGTGSGSTSAGPTRSGPTSGSPEVMTALETASRQFAVETGQFLVRRVPGFARAYFHMMSPYYGCRGGRSFMPEYRLTAADVEEGRRHPDVVFLGMQHAIHAERGRHADVEYSHSFDWPYRQLLPQRVEGLLGAGRSAIVPPPNGLRIRWQTLLSGQAAGVAAALAVQQHVLPRHLDVPRLQRVLHERYGVPLADTPERLAELGLEPAVAKAPG